jgi:hypothetical protein
MGPATTTEEAIMLRTDVRWRLGNRTRKSILVAHIASAGAWLGIDVVMGVLVFTAMFTSDEGVKALCFRALDVIAVVPLLTMGLLCLVTGVLLGVGSRYGLVRYWWVLIKLILNLVLSSLVLILLAPEISAHAELAQRAMPGDAVSLTVGHLVFPPIVSTTALLVAMTLAVFKPWGRVRPG